MGRGKGSRLFPLPIVPRALSIFSIITIFIRIPSESLCGGESCLNMSHSKKSLEEGGKKRRREPGMQGKEDGRFKPPAPLKEWSA